MNYPITTTLNTQALPLNHDLIAYQQNAQQYSYPFGYLQTTQIKLPMTPINYTSQTPKTQAPSIFRPQPMTLLFPQMNLGPLIQQNIIMNRQLLNQHQQQLIQSLKNFQQQQCQIEQQKIFNKNENKFPEDSNFQESPTTSDSLTEEETKKEEAPLAMEPKDLEQRIIEKFKLPTETILEFTKGNSIDLSSFQNKVHIPKTTEFTQIKYTNSQTGRCSNAFSCDYEGCGKLFRKWHNLFDHLRIHTNEKPFVCPVEGCGMEFNQVSNHKKHLDTHKARPYLSCAVCKEKFTKNKLLIHYRTHQQIEDGSSDFEEI